MEHTTNRSRFIAMTSAAVLTGMGAAEAAGGAPPMPKSRVSLSVIDVAGNLALTQPAIDKYKSTHGNVVDRITYIKATAPELAGKLKAQESANSVDIDLVLTGTDGLAAGIKQNIYLPLLPAFSSKFPNLMGNYLPPAANMQGLAQNFGIVVTYYPSGPLLEYAPERVKKVPKTADDLLAFTRANKGKFMYARPANSGPGRTFLMGLPYILKDKNPKDPIHGWEKTWAFLKALDAGIDYYPTGTTPTMQELGEGTRDMIASTTGWDINPRALGIVPKGAQVAALEGFHWVTDAHYMCIPRGISNDKLAVVLDLMAYMLQPAQQAYAYDAGYFYPGPAVKGVTLNMAPKDSQGIIAQYGRTEYNRLIIDHPKDIPLGADALVAAFDRWDREIGAAKVHK